jgi:hypothetical protein
VSSVTERQEYLREHLSYELLMLRYTATRLEHVRDQLLWNSLFESFGVHARNLYDFLRNEADSRNFKASDFVDDFDCGEIESVRGLIDKLRQQLLHLGKRRFKHGGIKLNSENAAKIDGWIEKAIAKFAAELPEQYREYWNPGDADPKKGELTAEPGMAPTQSSHPTYTIIREQTTETSVSSSIGWTGWRNPDAGKER